MRVGALRPLPPCRDGRIAEISSTRGPADVSDDFQRIDFPRRPPRVFSLGLRPEDPRESPCPRAGNTKRRARTARVVPTFLKSFIVAVAQRFDCRGRARSRAHLFFLSLAPSRRPFRRFIASFCAGRIRPDIVRSLSRRWVRGRASDFSTDLGFVQDERTRFRRGGGGGGEDYSIIIVSSPRTLSDADRPSRPS